MQSSRTGQEQAGIAVADNRDEVVVHEVDQSEVLTT